MIPTPASERLPWPVLVYLAATVLPIRYTIGPIQMTGLRTVLAIAIIPLAIALLRDRTHPARAIDILLVAFVAWVGLALSQSSPAQAIENAGATCLELLGGYMIARLYIRSASDFMRLIRALFVILLLVLPLAIYESWMGQPPLIQAIGAIPGVSSVAIVDIAPRLGLERVQAIFAHPIHFGLFASTLVSLGFIGLAGHASLTFRIACALLGASASFLALSSGAFLSVVLQVMLIIWCLAIGAHRGSWIALAALCALAYVMIDLASNRSPIRVFFSYATFSAHNAYWRGIIFEWGMVNVWQNPVFGLGLRDWVRPAFMHSGSMDNFWLVIAVRYGIPGFLLLAAAYFWGLAKVAFAPLAPHLAAPRRAWLICFTGLTFTLCTVHIWTSVFSFVFFLFGAGFWLLADQSEETAAKPRPRFLPYSRFAEPA